MQYEDSSDQIIFENFIYLNETNARIYYESVSGDILLASWKPEILYNQNGNIFRENAYHFASMISSKKPKLILVDCRYLNFQISYLDQIWYISQTKHLWTKSSIKKVAFVFASNLSAQIALEGLKDIAEEEGIRVNRVRIFNHISEAMFWLNLQY